MLNRILVVTLILSACLTTLIPNVALARDEIRVVGSSTVYPFITVVAETFSRKTDNRTPIIEATGTGGGMKLFCGGVGESFPDMTGASRKIKQSEFDMCERNGVNQPLEIKIGRDGIVLANARGATLFNLTKEDIFMALARDVPVNGEVKPNPHKTWKEVNPALPDVNIEVYGPPPTSGTRDAFVELVLEEACDHMEVMTATYPEKEVRHAKCGLLREDGAFIESGENDNLIIQKLTNNDKALGIFGYSFLDQNSDKVQGSHVNGIAPEFENVVDGSYPVTRPLYVYVKREHVGVIPGLKDLLKELVGDDAIGEEGYLTFNGLVPLSEEKRAAYKEEVSKL